MDHKTFLVTGAGRDIGQAIAVALGGEQAFGIVHYAHSEDGAGETQAANLRAGGDGVLVQADLSAEEDAATLVARAVEALGEQTLDTRVLNAADTAAVPIGGADPAALRPLLAVNVVAPTMIVDGLASRLSAGGSVTALSIAAIRQVFSLEFAFFSATKAAIDVMVNAWAVSLGPRGIRANAVAPGVVEANFRAQLLQDADFRSALEAQTALARPRRIEEVADVVAFLASDKARWITGQVVDASGGWKL